jgi:hypothetical protein
MMKQFTTRGKLLFSALIVSLITFSGSLAFGTSTNSVQLSITIYNSAFQSVTNLSGNMNITLLQNSTNNLGTAQNTSFRNNGSTAADYSIRADVVGVGISLQTNGGLGNPKPPSNTLRVLTLFYDWAAGAYLNSDFQVNDVARMVYNSCLPAGNYARNSDADSAKGFNVPPAGDRSLIYCLESGPISVNPLTGTVRIWVKATLH